MSVNKEDEMIQVRIDCALVEEFLETGKVIKASKIKDGIPPNYRLIRAYVEHELLILHFEPKDDAVFEKAIVVETFAPI